MLLPNRERKDELTKMGLDLTEHGGRNYVEVVLHGAEDAKRLREAKFAYTVEIADLYRQAKLRPRGRAAQLHARAWPRRCPAGAPAPTGACRTTTRR